MVDLPPLECHALQLEEVETLTAIYGSDMKSLNDRGTCFLINVRFLSEEIKEEDVIKIWFRYMYMYVHVLCLECRMSWVRVPPEAAHFLRKSDCLGCAVLLCLVVRLTLLASFFLPSHISVYMYLQIPLSQSLSPSFPSVSQPPTRVCLPCLRLRPTARAHLPTMMPMTFLTS